MIYVPMTDDELFHVVRNHSVDTIESMRAIERAVVSRFTKVVEPVIRSQQYNDEVHKD
jgi:L-rhamnose mutarotase